MVEIKKVLNGVNQLERNANKLIKAVSSKKVVLLTDASGKVKTYIKGKAPKGPSGRLIRAVYSKVYPETTSSPAHAYAGIRQGKDKAPHGHLVEQGHGGPQPAPPHPFFWKAVDEIKPVVQKDIEDGLKKTIEGAI
jgi:HK97 gp10 family phage protein